MQNTPIRRTILALGGVACALASPLALAHVGADLPHSHDTLMDSVMSGMAHPLTGLDHLAAMVSVGAWSALSLRSSQMLSAPLAFAGMLLAGALLGMAGLSLPGVEPMIAASLLVLGLMVATRLSLSTSAGAALVALFALFHGLAHGQELQGHAMGWLMGMLASTLVLHVLGLGIGLTLRDRQSPSRRWLTRLAGGGVALFGLSLLTPALAAIAR